MCFQNLNVTRQAVLKQVHVHLSMVVQICSWTARQLQNGHETSRPKKKEKGISICAWTVLSFCQTKIFQ